jgi:hypothetical protein
VDGTSIAFTSYVAASFPRKLGIQYCAAALQLLDCPSFASDPVGIWFNQSETRLLLYEIIKAAMFHFFGTEAGAIAVSTGSRLAAKALLAMTVVQSLRIRLSIFLRGWTAQPLRAAALLRRRDVGISALRRASRQREESAWGRQPRRLPRQARRGGPGCLTGVVDAEIGKHILRILAEKKLAPAENSNYILRNRCGECQHTFMN